MFSFCSPESCCPTFKRPDGDDRLNAMRESEEPLTCGVGIGLRYDSTKQKIVVGSLAPGDFFEEQEAVGCVVSYVGISMITGGPAHRSYKIENDDALIRIDGTEISSMKPSQLGPLLQGPRGSIVNLDLIRYENNEEIPIRVSLVRNWIMPPPASNRLGYLSVIIFASRAMTCFRQRERPKHPVALNNKQASRPAAESAPGKLVPAYPPASAAGSPRRPGATARRAKPPQLDGIVRPSIFRPTVCQASGGIGTGRRLQPWAGWRGRRVRARMGTINIQTREFD